jgi:VWFA-related protein
MSRPEGEAVMLAVRFLGLSLCVTAVAHAQAPGTAAADSQDKYTISAGVRLVITDVSVTDSSGRAVHGLKESDFHISEDSKPEQIRSFDEQQRSAKTMPTGVALPKGVYSNVAMGALPATANVLLIDPFNTEITDQMYLRVQLLRFIAGLNGKDTVAIFAVNSGHAALLLQDFTNDPALLRAAVTRELPRLIANGGNATEHFEDALGTLSTISAYLSRIPGHKNLIWYSTYFPLTQQPEGFVTSDYDAQEQELVHIYNQLSLDRVSVYPVNADGPDPTRPPPVGQEAAMDKIAQITGGQAYYNRNDLGHVAALAIDSGSEYYTLSYRPKDFVADNKFHTIQVVVDGGWYTLHYRSGYVAFDEKADASTTLSAEHLAKTNADLDVIAAGGQLARTKNTTAATDSVTDYSAPGPALAGILFEARILPVSQVPGWKVVPPERDRKGRVIGDVHDEPFVIEYSAFSKDLRFVPTPGGKEHAELIAVAMASTETGEVVGTAIERIQVNYSPNQMEIADRTGTPVRLQIRLPRESLYVSLSLIDNLTGHTGALELPYTAPKP